MSEGGSAHELRGVLREELAARLAQHGWLPAGAPGVPELPLAAFTRQLDDEFVATAEIDMAGTWPDRPPVILTGLTVGVAYEPLRRLSPLLGEWVRLAVLEDVRRASDETEGDDDAVEDD